LGVGEDEKEETKEAVLIKRDMADYDPKIYNN